MLLFFSACSVFSSAPWAYRAQELHTDFFHDSAPSIVYLDSSSVVPAQMFRGLYSKAEEETDRVKEQNKNLFVTNIGDVDPSQGDKADRRKMLQFK